MHTSHGTDVSRHQLYVRYSVVVLCSVQRPTIAVVGALCEGHQWVIHWSSTALRNVLLPVSLLHKCNLVETGFNDDSSNTVAAQKLCKCQVVVLVSYLHKPCFFYDELAFLVLLTGLKSHLLCETHAVENSSSKQRLVAWLVS